MESAMQAGADRIRPGRAGDHSENQIGSGSRLQTDSEWPGRVLVVEDEPVSRMIIRFLLEKLGIAVDTAANGKQALDKLLTGSFDLVFMDVQMPVMDGIQATRTLRTDPDYVSVSAVRVVALTAHTSPEDQERILEAGMDGYMAKPVRKDMLAEMLERERLKGC